MDILYDGFIFGAQPLGGINRYFRSLIGHLPATDRPTLWITGQSSATLPKHPRLQLQRGPVPRLPKLLRRIGHRLENRHFRNRLPAARADLMHPTYYACTAGDDAHRHHRLPVVLTVYDMIHERFPAELDRLGRLADLKREAIRAARRVICISQHTKNELLEHYSLPEDRVSVTHLAADLQPPPNQPPLADPPYLLYVGGRAAHKNFDRLLQAFQQARARHGDVLLRLVGPKLKPDEQERIADLQLLNHVKHEGLVDDRRLAHLYAASHALIYPSLSEGFGIPPLEAMQCGTAVLASNVSSIPEVVGDAGLLFDPHGVEAMADAMLRILESSSLREELIERGRVVARRFSWAKTAALTRQVYQQAVE